MNRRPKEPGKPFMRVRLDGRDKLPSQNRLAVKLTGAAREAESRPAREPSQADLDRHARMQGLESRAAEAAMRERRAMERREMDGFKDSTRMRYVQGGSVEKYSKGGGVQGPPATTPSTTTRGTFDRNRLPDLGAAPGSGRSAPGVSVQPSLRGGMPGIKVKGRFAKGGEVKGAAKVAKVMGEFKRGELHSGSKKGPKVTSKKQATAIALSEARDAGAKIPAPKKRGVPVASREPMVKAKGGLCTTLKR